MWNKLSQYFEGRGFRSVDLHQEGMRLFYVSEGESCSLVWMLQKQVAENLTKEQYSQYQKTISEVFYRQGFKFVHLHTLFFFSDTAKAKEIAANSMFWIVDESYGRLVVYENQPEDFLGLRKMIENNLAFGGNSRNSQGMQMNANTSNFRRTVNMKQEVVRKKKYRRSQLRSVNYITFGLIAINILLFFATDLFSMTEIVEEGALAWWSVFEDHQYYRIFTCMFLHGDISHISSNMMALFVIGDVVERDMGHLRYAILYFGAGLVGSLASVIYNYIGKYPTYSIGASGAIYGVAGAMVMMVLVNPVLRNRQNYTRMGIFVVFLFYSMILNPEAAIDYLAHLGGFIAGSLLYFVMDKIKGLLAHRRQKARR